MREALRNRWFAAEFTRRALHRRAPIVANGWPCVGVFCRAR